MRDFRNQLFDRLLGQSIDFFTDRRTGDVLSRVNNDVSGIPAVLVLDEATSHLDSVSSSSSRRRCGRCSPGVPRS